LPPADARNSDLDQTVRRADPNRWLASRFIGDRRRRAAVIAIYAFDHELERARKVASGPLLAQIRLTWWREALDEIFEGRLVRAHPVARALADAVARHDLPRNPLEAMIDARIETADKARLNPDEALRWADAVGGSATILAARALDPSASSEAAALAGRAWGLVLLRRAGLIEAAEADEPLVVALAGASRAAKGLGVAAFPAAACATLARARPRSGGNAAIETRLRLLWAVLSGTL
jgi:15-cis-phytoene synthase